MEGLGLQQRADLPQRPAELAVTAAADPRLPGVRRVQADDHPHCGGLAGSVRAEETRHGSRVHVEAEPVDGDSGAVPFGETTGLYH
jgi:hypothetical protein